VTKWLASSRTTSACLRAIRNGLNPGGQSKLARLLGWHYSTLWRKPNGKNRITQSDELAIRQSKVSVQAERFVP
jgi:hypothetical protein